MNYILQSYNLDKIPVEMRGKGVGGLLEFLGLGERRVIRGYDEEAFKKLAMGTPMVVWNMSDYDEIIQGIDKNRPGHTFLFKERADTYDGKIIKYWDQFSDNKETNSVYTKESLDYGKNMIGFSYSDIFYDIEDLIDNINRMSDN